MQEGFSGNVTAPSPTQAFKYHVESTQNIVEKYS